MAICDAHKSNGISMQLSMVYYAITKALHKFNAMLASRVLKFLWVKQYQLGNKVTTI